MVEKNATVVRNAILALIILAVGVWIMLKWSENMLTERTQFADLLAPFVQFRSLFNLFLIGVGILIVLLIPVYISKRRAPKSEEKPL
jgi:anaerobic C4-dicarboxylate transporter